jgi:hypothetical protein
MSWLMPFDPLAAALIAPLIAPLTAPSLAMRVSRDLRTGFGAVSRTLAILASHGWQSAGRPTEMIDEPCPRTAPPPFLPAAAGFQ